MLVDGYRAVLVRCDCEFNITAILFTEESSAVPEEEWEEEEMYGELKSCLTSFYVKCVPVTFK